MKVKMIKSSKIHGLESGETYNLSDNLITELEALGAIERPDSNKTETIPIISEKKEIIITKEETELEVLPKKRGRPAKQ